VALAPELRPQRSPDFGEQSESCAEHVLSQSPRGTRLCMCLLPRSAVVAGIAAEETRSSRQGAPTHSPMISFETRQAADAARIPHAGP
jgi:hypothetical protein